VTNRTIEILGKAYDFNNPQYLELRHEIREKHYTQKNQAKKIEETGKTNRKFRAKASKQWHNQSMIKAG
jgi:ATP-binding cassette subfamily F protein 3